jgi:hypothetical protein
MGPGFYAVNELEHKPAPIVVQLSGFEETCVESLAALHRQLRASQNVKRLKGAVFDQVKGLDLPADSILLLTQSFGEQYPAGKKVGEAFLSLITSRMWQQDNTYHLLFVLRPGTGEVLWADSLYETGGNRTEVALKRGLEKLLSDLPNHPSKH